MTVTKNGTIPAMNKLLWALAGAMTAAVGSPAPPALQSFGWIILLLTFADTCVGFYVAARFREVESRKFLEKLADKSVLFLVMGLVGFVASVVMRNWAAGFVVASSIVAYEVLSLIESGRRLARREARGTVLLNVFDKIGQIFKDSADPAGMKVEQTETQKTTTTVTMATHPEEKKI